jgi:hypothetical protein
MACKNPFCLPTCWYVDDAECPGSDSSSHHCIDCDGLCWDEKGATCSECEDYWCTDYQSTFHFSVCTHLGDRYEEDEESSIGESIEGIQEGLCTQCVLMSNLKCTVEDCKFNHKNLLQAWVKFCERSLDVELATLVRQDEKIIIKAKLYRKRPTYEENLSGIWGINKEEVELYIDGVKQPETLSWKKTLNEAKRVIQEQGKEGFTVKSKCFALNEKHSRDKSPERK